MRKERGRKERGKKERGRKERGRKKEVGRKDEGRKDEGRKFEGRKEKVESGGKGKDARNNYLLGKRLRGREKWRDRIIPVTSNSSGGCVGEGVQLALKAPDITQYLAYQ